MKKRNIVISIVIMLIIAITLVGCEPEVNCGGGYFRAENARRFKEKYEALNGSLNARGDERQTIYIPEDNPMIFATAAEIVELVESGTGVIYFGFPECPWCRTAVPILIDAAAELGIETIFYLNMTLERDIRSIDAEGNIVVDREGTPEYQRLQELLYDILMIYVLVDAEGNVVDTGERRIYVPFILVVRNGTVLASHFYTLPIQDETPFMIFDESQRQELLEIYLELLRTLQSCEIATPGC